MTSLFLVHRDRIMLLFRRGSRAIADSWVGIGGHVEPGELGDLTDSLHREVTEEVGLSRSDVREVTLRYIGIRATTSEIRHTYYFTGRLAHSVPAPSRCAEGDLRWFPLDDLPTLAGLEMPPTARAVLDHWISTGRHDALLRSVTVGPQGCRVAELTGA